MLSDSNNWKKGIEKLTIWKCGKVFKLYGLKICYVAYKI